MKDVKGHGSNPRGAHAEGTEAVGREPMTMYHGSRADFSNFSRARGLWLAEHPETAIQYAEEPTPNRVKQGKGPPMLYEAKVQGTMASEDRYNKEARKLDKEDYENDYHSPPGKDSWANRFDRLSSRLGAAGYDGIHFDNHTVYLFNTKNAKMTKKTPLQGGTTV